jgi:hypothetical protein
LADTNELLRQNVSEFNLSNSTIDYNLDNSYEIEGLNTFDSSNNSYILKLYKLNSKGSRTVNFAEITEDYIILKN